MGEHVVRAVEGADRARLEAALARNEFVLFYQPKVDLRDGQVVGAEALIRWQHPERGLLAPGRFLPLIDDSDLTAAVGRWVIEAAVEQVGRWRAEGFEIAVNVNVAARHLSGPGFADDVAAALEARPDVPVGLLELEVAEQVALNDAAGVAAVIDACRQQGVRFALDDFGTGPTSLSVLRDLRVDTLKIDQMLVRDMLDDRDSQAMVEGVIGLGRAFRRQVVAAGVETATHCVALINSGCLFGQGYGIARPMPAAETTDWVRSRPAVGGQGRQS